MFFDAGSELKEIAWYEAQHDLKDIDNESGRDRLAWLRKQLNLPPLKEEKPPKG